VTPMFSFSYQLETAGWSTATVSDGERSVVLTASYLSDALGDLTRAVIALLRGAEQATLTWHEEPGRARSSTSYGRSKRQSASTATRKDGKCRPSRSKSTRSYGNCCESVQSSVAPIAMTPPNPKRCFLFRYYDKAGGVHKLSWARGVAHKPARVLSRTRHVSAPRTRSLGPLTGEQTVGQLCNLLLPTTGYAETPLSALPAGK